MALCRIYEWQREKTVKLSDTYDVEIRIENDSGLRSNYVKLPECTSVTLPEYKYREEVYRYGNNAKKFLIPDYSGLEDVSIELIEHYKDDLADFAHLRVQDIVNVCLNKLFDSKTFTYRTGDYIDELRITVYKNNFSHSIIRYVFESLKLTDYTKYDLDYNSTELAKWTLKFSYQSYYVEDIVADEEEKKRAEEERKRQAEWEEQYRQQTAARNEENRNRAGRYGRGVPTPKQDEEMARRYRENLLNGEGSLNESLEQKQAERKQKVEELIILEAANNGNVSTKEEEATLEEARQKTAGIEERLNAAKTKQRDAGSDMEQYAAEEAEHSKNAEELRRKHTGKSGFNWGASETADEQAKADTAKQKKDAATESYIQANGEIARLEAELEVAREEEEKARVVYDKKAGKNKSAEQRRQRIEQLNEEIDVLSSEIIELKASKQEQIEVAQQQQQDFNAERNSMSSEQKLRTARYQDSAEHAERDRAAESKENKLQTSDLENAYDLAHMDKWESDAVTRAQENYDRAAEAEAETARRTAEKVSKLAGSALDDVSEMMQAEENLKASREETKYNMEKAKWGDAQQDMGKSVRNEQAEVASTMNKRTLGEMLDPDGLTNPDNSIGYIPDVEDVLALNELDLDDNDPITVPFIGATAVIGQETKQGKTTLLDVPSTVYSSEKFNDRVTELLSSELYSNMNDKQLAYDRAQKQALDEYMRGELRPDNK